jgi:hypothetical protein
MRHVQLLSLAFAVLCGDLVGQESKIPTPPLNAGQSEIGLTKVEFPIRPTGKYAFVARFTPSTEEQKVRDTLPFEWIEIEWMIPGQLYKNIPPVDHRLRLSRDGDATYVTGSFGDDIIRSGRTDLGDFGRYSLLLEQFRVGKKDCDLGRTVNVSHPLESTLRVKPVDSDPHTFRNADKIGDYRFWLIQTALMQQVSEIKWKEQKDTEPTDAPKSATARP